jgi:hypothetical protein
VAGSRHRWALSSPIITRVGKEVNTFDGDHDDFEGGLGVGGEPLLVE